MNTEYIYFVAFNPSTILGLRVHTRRTEYSNSPITAKKDSAVSLHCPPTTNKRATHPFQQASLVVRQQSAAHKARKAHKAPKAYKAPKAQPHRSPSISLSPHHTTHPSTMEREQCLKMKEYLSITNARNSHVPSPYLHTHTHTYTHIHTPTTN